MTGPDEIITDASLRRALETTHSARDQCLLLMELSKARVQASQAIQDAPSTETHAQKTLQVHLSRLRGDNRSAVHRVRRTKLSTAEARGEVDELRLRLQNLYYEQRHLRGEIDACEDYDHKYQSLPLIALEEFLRERPDLVDADETTLMEARINHEHAERETLEQRRQGLLKSKQSLIAENKKRKDDLASLDQDLEKFIDAAKPIQKIFEKEY